METSSTLVGKLWRSSSAGGGGGKAFSDINWPPAGSDQIFAQQANPVEVRVRVGRYVDQVQMIWEHYEHPARGGDGSTLQSFVLNANEYITNVRLTGSRYVGSIEFITNQGRNILFGKQSNTVIDLEVPANHQVVGFYGQSGRWIDQLGVIAVPVSGQTIGKPKPPQVPNPERPSDSLLGKLPRAGIELIKEFEGYAKALSDGRAQAYADPLKGWALPTIGYGTTRYPDGVPVKQGDIINKDQAEEYLIDHVDKSCRKALEKIPTWNRMNINQRGALYSFAYNLGSGFYRGYNFESITRVCDSPEQWNDHRWIEAQFVKYRNPGTSVEEGLRRRRLAEAALFCKKVTSAAPNWDDDHDEAGEAGDRKPEERLDRIVRDVAGKQPVGAGLTPEMSFDTLITPHITYGEFALYEESRRFRHGFQCKTAYEIAVFLEKCRDYFGGNPLVITSGYRPPSINAKVGGARRSEHLYDAPDTGAVDFYIKNVSVYEVEAWCDQQYPHSIGYGAKKGFVHLGMRPGKPRVRWVY
ncbi:D-Ala-D-Ala carboxypeptidase family metallohydrolase [Leptothoe sp. ISB3NOV94-8A]|nr:D-Ala-D-Ala carboxypeptidase family metallohydrolase [Leptothoe sp. LEGE 181152]